MGPAKAIQEHQSHFRIAERESINGSNAHCLIYFPIETESLTARVYAFAGMHFLSLSLPHVVGDLYEL